MIKMKLLFAASVFISVHAQAGWAWDLKVAFARGIGCGTSKCTSATQAPDKVTPKKVAFTFDDGPSATLTPKVLEILKKHSVKATFFILGKNVASNSALIRRMVDEGHIVASHSWNHPSFWKLNETNSSTEINTTHQAFLDIGLDVQYFRYPNGNSTEYADSVLKNKGYKVVGWNVDTCDWGFNKAGVLSGDNNKICNGSTAVVKDAKSYLLDKITSRGGGIILMHDVQKVTVDNLDYILTELKDMDYEFVNVDDARTFPLLNQ